MRSPLSWTTDASAWRTMQQSDPSAVSPALGRKSWLFAGSERGGDRAAFMYTLIVAAKMNDIDPQAWLADVLKRLPEMPVARVHDLLPWNWKAAKQSELSVKAA